MLPSLIAFCILNTNYVNESAKYAQIDAYVDAACQVRWAAYKLDHLIYDNKGDILWPETVAGVEAQLNGGWIAQESEEWDLIEQKAESFANICKGIMWQETIWGTHPATWKGKYIGWGATSTTWVWLDYIADGGDSKDISIELELKSIDITIECFLEHIMRANDNATLALRAYNCGWTGMKTEPYSHKYASTVLLHATNMPWIEHFAILENSEEEKFCTAQLQLY